MKLNVPLKMLPIEIIFGLEATANHNAMKSLFWVSLQNLDLYLNPQPTDNVGFSTTVCFFQISSPFLLFWEAGTAFIILYIKFLANKACFSVRMYWFTAAQQGRTVKLPTFSLKFLKRAQV